MIDHALLFTEIVYPYLPKSCIPIYRSRVFLIANYDVLLFTDYISSYSFTFSTWEGHVEAGEITFTVSQFGESANAFKTFTISSNSRSAGFLSDKAYRFLGGQEAQTQHWENLLKNLETNTGARKTTPFETTQTSETPINNSSPEIKQGGN